MPISEERYLCGSRYASEVWTQESAPKERPIWNRRMKGLSAVIASAAVLAMFLASGSTNRPLEATVHMERLAVKLQQMKAIHPDTAQTIASLVLQPSYDCNQLACSPAVQVRNSTARSRLKAILAKGSGEMQAAEGMPTVNISTNPTAETGRVAASPPSFRSMRSH
jgi:hypothetical protein